MNTLKVKIFRGVLAILTICGVVFLSGYVEIGKSRVVCFPDEPIKQPFEIILILDEQVSEANDYLVGDEEYKWGIYNESEPKLSRDGVRCKCIETYLTQYTSHWRCSDCKEQRVSCKPRYKYYRPDAGVRDCVIREECIVPISGMTGNLITKDDLERKKGLFCCLQPIATPGETRSFYGGGVPDYESCAECQDLKEMTPYYYCKPSYA